MKRKIWLILSIIFAMVSVLGMAVACGKDPIPDEPPQPSAEQGEYYYSAGSKEYSLELILGNLFTLEIEGEDLSGKYVLDGELLTLTVEGGNELSATYRNDVVTLTFGNDTYRFLRKINYTVKFETNGGTAVADATVVNGKTVAKPENPEKDDLVFVGWYTDNNTFRNVFSFTQPITANLTLYARFVERINPEFTVSFDVNHEGGEELPTQETVGHKLFNLPTPEWAGHTFVGWWMSQYESADKLTAEYTEQTIDEPITLYAVWESNAPAVSVTEKGVSWHGRSGNVSYTITIIGPDEEILVNNFALSVAEYAFDFTTRVEGDYIVKVTMNGQTATAYYRNRGLARVKVFQVTESTLFFNPVPNATNYLLTVECGSADHSHIDIDLGTETSWDFSECGMTANGISFVVKATADGYLTSVSEPYTFLRTLDPVTGLKVDDTKDVVTWEAVERATGYIISVSIDDQVVYTAKLDEVSNIDLQYYNSGEVTVTVVPTAFGWISPAATEYKYTKAHLATPTNPHLSGSTVEWDVVAGAEGYEVIFDGKTYQVSTNAFELKEEYYDATQSSYVFTVRALGKTDAQNSLWMPEFTIRNGQMGEISYEAGKVVWDAVFGVNTFLVKLNDGEEVEVSETSLAITLLQKGENTIYVCAVNSDGTHSEWKKVEVFAYAIEFDTQGGEDIAPLYVVKGDPLSLPKATRYGYTFNNWLTEPEGQGEPFDRATFQDEYDRTIYADWTANEYRISFNTGIFGEGPYDEDGKPVTSVTVSFGSAFQLPLPDATDIMYAFSGWVDSANLRYTNYKGASVSAYLYAGDITLTAAWVPIFEFKQNDNGEWAVSKGQGINYVTEVTIPVMYRNSLISIVQDFTSCGTMETINIPDTIKNIVLASDGAAFQQCDALKNINIYSSGFPTDVVYYSIDGVLFYYNAAADGGRMEIKYYPYARQEVEYTIPSTIKYGPNEEDVYYVSAIPSGAFRSSNYNTNPMTKINIPATISLIELRAFYNFYNLAEMNFLPVQEGEVEASGLDIRQSAFGDSSASLSTARIRYIKLPKRLSENPRDAFVNLTYLAYVDVESGGKFSSVDGLIVQNSETINGLELVYYPRNRQLGEDGKAIIPDNFSTVGRATEFRVPDEIYAIGREAVKDNTTLKKVIIPGHVEYIGVSAFQGLRYVEEIIFEGEKEDKDLVIDERAFLGENWTTSSSSTIPDWSLKLTSLTLPANLVKIGKNAFGSLTGGGNTSTALHEVYVNVDRTAEQIDFAAGAFTGTIPGAANSTSHITILHFGAGVPEFEILDVFGANVKEVYVDENNPNYWSDPDTGVLYDAAREKLIIFPASWEGPYTIPTGITNIQSGMFKERTGLTEIIIHKNVTRVGDNAFNGCTALVKVVFEQGGEDPLTIEEAAFSGCKVLANVELPERLISLGHHAFRECVTLTAIKLPKSLQFLALSGIYNDMEVFYGCNNLKDLTVAEGSPYFKVEGGVLYSLRAAKLTPDGAVTNVPDRVMYVPNGVSGEIKVSGYIRGIGSLAFSRSNSSERAYVQITKVVFEDIIETYDPESGEPQSSEIDFNPHNGNSSGSPFYYMNQLIEVHFPKGMNVMTDYLIVGCTYLEKVNVPVTVTSISAYAFGSNSKLKVLTFDETDKVEENRPLRIENHKTSSGSYGNTNQYSLFGSMSELKSIKFPARLTYLGSYAFYTLTGEHSEYRYSYIENIEFAEESLFGITLSSNAMAQTSKLKTVKLPKDLVEIPNYAFSYSGLESIVIPEGIQSIGNYAFNSCSALTTVTIPSTIKSIGNYAFGSTKLTALNLPEGLETIGTNVFSSVSTLEGELRIPASVTTIGSNAFNNTRYSKIITAKDNKLASIGDYAFASNDVLTTVEFGKTDTPLTFGKFVFNADKNLTSFEFPTNVKEIGESMFANLATLKTVTFANGTSQLETVNQLAFSKTGLTEINFPESSAAGGIALKANLFKSCTSFTKLGLSASITSIDGVLGGCATIKTITIDPANKSLEADEKQPIIYAKGANGERGAIMLVYGALTGTFTVAPGTTVIGANAFANQVDIEIIELPASVMEIGNYAFQNCVNLKKVIIPNDSALTTIGSGAFMNCWSLESINLESAVHLREFGDGKYSYSPAADHNGVFMYAGIHSANPLKIKLPASVEKVGTYMFTNSGVVEVDMSAATKLTALPTGIYTTSYGGLGIGFFSGSAKLTTVTLPNTITFLGVGTFGSCTALETLDFSNLKDLKYVGTTANTAPTTSTYSMYLFAQCKNLQTITFPTSLTGIGGRCFVGCDKLTTINGLDNVNFVAPYIYVGAGITSVTISKNPTNYMFMDCKSLKSVTFDGISSITATYLFQNSGIQSIDLSGTTLTTLPNYMFDGCASLTQVKLPATLTATGTYTFRNCTSLTTIDLSGCASLTRIGSTTATGSVTVSTGAYTFSGCTSLERVVLPESLTLIGAYTFDGCTSLNTINLDKVTLLGNYCFRNTGFTEITIPSSVTAAFGTYLFANCAKLTKVTVPATFGITAASIGGNYMFQNCPNLTTVEFGATNKTLSYYMFQNCPALTTVDMTNFTGTFGSNMFDGCTSLKNVTMPKSFAGCASSAFKGTAVESIDLSGCKGAALGSYMFQNCSNLREVKLSPNFNCLGTYTFQNCTSLTSIDISGTKVDRFASTYNGNVTATTSTYVFDGCVNLETVTTKPGQIVQVGAYTFRNCEKLASFDFSGVVRLSTYSFQNAGLTGTVTLPACLEQYYMSGNYYPLTGCTGITEFKVDPDNKAGLVAVDGALVLASSGMILHLPGGATIEGGVLDLNDEKFAQATLNNFAFNGISNIKKLILPKNMTDIPANMFYNSGIEEVVLPAGLKTIGNYAFQNSGLKTIEIPASVTSIGTGAFAGTYQLEKVTFLEPAAGEEAVALTLAAGATTATATTVGVFRGSAIKNITLPGRMGQLAAGAFHYAAVETVTLSEGTTAIDAAAFAYATSLKTLNVPASVTTYGNYAFAFTNVTNLMLGEGVTTLGTYVYSNVETLGDLKPEDFKNVTTLGNDVFYCTTNIKNVEFSNKVVSTGMYLFEKSNIENVKFPGTMTTIGNYMFRNCEHLVSAVIEDSVEGLERSLSLSGTFENSSIQSAVIGEGVVSISSLFKNCSNLKEVKLPESLTTINTETFRNCTSLKSVVIYDNIASIALGSTSTTYNDGEGTGPFAGWTSEQTIYFTASRSYISALVGMEWVNNASNRLKANIVFDYVPATQA